MAAPGWYPDPESMSRERYWDGQAWSLQVRETGTQVRPAMPSGPLGPSGPSGPVTPPAGEEPTVIGRPGGSDGPGRPAPAAFQPFRPSVPLPDLDEQQTRLPPPPPSTPGPPGQGAPGRAGYVAPGSTPGGGGRRTGLVVGLVAAVVVVVGGGAAALLLLGGEDDAAVDPTSASTPPSPTASPRLDDLCGSGDALDGDERFQGGRARGGGLSLPVPDGFENSDGGAFSYSFTTDPVTLASKVRGTDYFTTYTLAALDRSDFGTPAEAVEAVLGCYAEGGFYVDPQAFYTPGEQEEVTVDGAPAVSMRGEYRLQDGDIAGGDVQAIVVDTDDPDVYGLFVGDQVLDDDAELAQRAEVVETLRVE